MSDFATFAREADDRARAVERRILPDIENALGMQDPVQRIYEVLKPEFERVYETPGLSDFASVKRTTADAWEWFRGTLDSTLKRLKPKPSEARAQAERLASWLGVATVNGALVAAGETEASKRWTSQHDDRVRHFHVEADGQTVLMSEPFVVCDGREMLYPGQPVGSPDCWINCVVGSTDVLWPGQRLLASTRYVATGEFCDVETVDGHKITVTPNHPIATPLGYVAADELRPGDYVMAASLSEPPQVGHAPTSVEQVHESLRVAGHVQRVGAVAVDFHGDRPDSEVEVVWADRDLTREVGVEAGERVLVGAGVTQGPLSGGGPAPVGFPAAALVPGGGSLRSPGAGGDVGGGGQGSAFVAGEALHSQSQSLAPAPGAGAGLGESAPYDTGADADFPRHLNDALAVGMTPRQIVKVNRYSGSHPVYNLHTSGGWYSAGGIVVHNCRCFVVPVTQEAAAVSTNTAWTAPANAPTGNSVTLTFNPPLTVQADAASDADFTEAELDELDVESAIGDTLIPWHAVLAPEGVASGDGRKFSEGALTWRDLPLPLRWQKVDAEGHGGSVVVGRIDNVFREGNLILADGVFLATEEADDLIGMVAEQAVRGISVDVDSAELSIENDEEFKGTEFSKGRVSSATVVPIPAFAEAYIALGERPEAGDEFRNVSTEERKGLADKGAAMPDGSYPIANCADLKNAIQAVGRAKDRAATIRHIKKRAGALNCPVELPSDWSAADLDEFGPVPRGPGDKRGPGWVTAPKATRRIHDYWTRGEGAAKIGWGSPGDFNRCKRQLAKYVKPPYLNRTCAEWHMDALGYWPATHAAKDKHKNAAETVEAKDCGCGVNLVAAATTAYPAVMFASPGFASHHALEVYEFYDGLYGVRGHLATWGTCHIGIKGVCTTAPKSATDYRMFRTGMVRLSDGGTITVGQITMGCGHADLGASSRSAAAHYDNTGSVVADVACGEDDHGIWVAGVVRPGVTEEQRTALQAGALSGDWRSVGGNLELVAALCVNVPGFPVPRTGLAASAGEQTALVAAGVVRADHTQDDLTVAQARKIIKDLRTSRAARVMEDVRHERLVALSDI